MEKTIYKPEEFAHLTGVGERTLKRWDEKGILRAYRTITGRKYYTTDQYENRNEIPEYVIYMKRYRVGEPEIDNSNRQDNGKPDRLNNETVADNGNQAYEAGDKGHITYAVICDEMATSIMELKLECALSELSYSRMKAILEYLEGQDENWAAVNKGLRPAVIFRPNTREKIGLNQKKDDAEEFEMRYDR